MTVFQIWWFNYSILQTKDFFNNTALFQLMMDIVIQERYILHTHK